MENLVRILFIFSLQQIEKQDMVLFSYIRNLVTLCNV